MPRTAFEKGINMKALKRYIRGTVYPYHILKDQMNECVDSNTVFSMWDVTYSMFYFDPAFDQLYMSNYKTSVIQDRVGSTGQYNFRIMPRLPVTSRTRETTDTITLSLMTSHRRIFEIYSSIQGVKHNVSIRKRDFW